MRNDTPTSPYGVHRERDGVTLLLRALGAGLLAVGVAALVAVAVTLWQLVTAPAELIWAQMFAEFLLSDTPIARIESGGREGLFHLDPAFRWVLVGLVGAVALLSLAATLNVCISGGLKLLRFAEERATRDSD